MLLFMSNTMCHQELGVYLNQYKAQVVGCTIDWHVQVCKTVMLVMVCMIKMYIGYQIMMHSHIYQNERLS